MPNIVGVDTASNRFHWSANFPLEGYKYGWGLSDQRNVDAGRAVLFRHAVTVFSNIYTFSETHVFCEEPLVLTVNIETTRKLCMAAGAIFAGFVQADLANSYWHWVDQSTWKKQILGRGVKPKDYGLELPRAKREKEWIRERVLAHPDFEAGGDVMPDFHQQQDLFDAWAIMKYGEWWVSNVAA